MLVRKSKLTDRLVLGAGSRRGGVLTRSGSALKEPANWKMPKRPEIVIRD